MAILDLYLCQEIIGKILYLTSADNGPALQINKRQSRLVAKKLSETQEILNKIQQIEHEEGTRGSSHNVRIWGPAKTELQWVLKSAETLIGDCCCNDQWLKAAIRQGDRREAFARILYDLQWCTSLILLTSTTTNREDRRSNFGPADCEGKLSVVDSFDLSTAAKEDEDTLKVALQHLKANHVCGGLHCDQQLTEQCLATKLLDKLAAEALATDMKSDFKKVLENLDKEGRVVEIQTDLREMLKKWEAEALAVDVRSDLEKLLSNVYAGGLLVDVRSALTGLLKKVNTEALAIEKTDLTTAPLFLWVNEQDLPRGKFLGEGTFGEVKETVLLEQKFAVKICKGLHQQLSFSQEIGALAMLNHPNIVHLVCCSEGNRTFSLVMELMHKSLHGLLTDHRQRSRGTRLVPFSQIRAVDLMLQIAEGMKCIHGKKLAHRDIKSLNILVNFADPSSRALATTDALYIAKVADFGTTKMKNDFTRHSHQTLNLGSTKWMAPEAFFLLDDEDAPLMFQPMRSDVYSFGIVCWELLTGEEPHENVRNVRKEVKNGRRPELPPDSPPRLAALLRRCWDGNPDKRPDFPEICTQLRYIKGLLVQDDQSLLKQQELKQREFGIGIQTQGPWGSNDGGSPFYDGVATSIKRLKLEYTKFPSSIWYMKVDYDCNGRQFSSTHGEAGRGGYTDEIVLDNANEFIIQIEGSFGISEAVTVDGNRVIALKSLTFHTNLKKTYGPYGGKGETNFSSDEDRVVGFFGRSGMLLDQIGIFCAPGSYA